MLKKLPERDEALLVRLRRDHVRKAALKILGTVGQMISGADLSFDAGGK